MADFGALIGYRTRDQLVALAMERLRTAGSAITNLNVGGVFRTLLELAGQGLADLYSLLLVVVPKGYVATAIGEWLDAKAADVGLTRHLAQKTQGELTFSREVAGGNVIIREGTLARTPPSAQGVTRQFRVTAETVLLEGQTDVAVPVEASAAGATYNVAAGLITELVTAVAGVDSITNGEGWITSPGTDDETDFALRQRCQLRWYELARGATKHAYIAWAREVAGVADVAVLDQFPRGQGTVDVVITGPAGQPGDDLVAAVQAYLEARRPLCADVLVRGPVDVSTPVRVCVQIPQDAADEDAVHDAVLARLNSLMAAGDVAGVPRLTIAQDLFRSRLVALALQASDVALNAVAELPAADLVAGDDELISAESIEVIVERIQG